jgi:hypothetical protein
MNEQIFKTEQAIQSKLALLGIVRQWYDDSGMSYQKFEVQQEIDQLIAARIMLQRILFIY